MGYWREKHSWSLRVDMFKHPLL